MRPISRCDGGHGGWLWALLLLSGLSVTHAAEAGTAEELLSRYHAEAQAESAAFRGFSVEEGRIFYFRRYPAPVVGEVGCVSCHLDDPRRSILRHRSKILCRACHVIDDAEHVYPLHAKKRKIDAFSPVANPRRFTDPDVVEKWFRLNCNYLLKRPCTAAEKGNLLAWLLTLPRGELDNKPQMGKEYDFLLQE